MILIISFFIINIFFIKNPFLDISNIDKNNKIIVLHTDIVKKINYNDNIWNLSGNIILKHKDYIIKCNKAIYYSNNNKFIGYGNVLIKNINNIIKFSALKIEYNGNNGIFKSYGNAIFIDEKKN